MGLLDKLEQVEIKADSRLPEDDLMFCETQQQAYDESCRALREIRQQWKKAIQAQRDLLGIGQDGSLPYFGSNYRFGITDLNRELEKFHSRFISELTQHFNEKYSVTISTDAIKEHLIPAEPDPYRCDMDTSKEYHRNLRDLSLHYTYEDSHDNRQEDLPCCSTVYIRESLWMQCVSRIVRPHSASTCA